MSKRPSAKDVLAKSERAGYGCDFSAADEDTIRVALRLLADVEQESWHDLLIYASDTQRAGQRYVGRTRDSTKRAAAWMKHLSGIAYPTDAKEEQHVSDQSPL